MTTDSALPTPLTAAKRPYVTPALVTHGDVRALTQGQTGTQLDQDSTGSFTPQDAGAAKSSGQ